MSNKSEKTLFMRAQFNMKTDAEWKQTPDVVLRKGEQIFVIDDNDSSIVRMKVGDGTTSYRNLSYVSSQINEDELKSYIDDIVGDIDSLLEIINEGVAAV